MDSNQITYPVTFALRRGTSTDLYEVNETLHQGEPVIETDTLKIKIGDGETPYNELDYVGASELADLEIDISKLQEQINTFFADADISAKAIDTLVEIQKILNDSSIDIQNLLNKVNEFEALHQEINADIKKVENDFKTADNAIIESHNKDKEEIDAQINELAKSCNDALSLAAADRNAIREEIAVADKAISQASAAARAEIREEIAELANAHNLDNTNANERIDRVEEKYREADNEIITAYKAADELLSQALTIAKADVLEIHYADKEAVTAQLHDFAKECSDIHSELRLLINAVNTAFQTADTEIINILNNAIADIRSKVKSLEAKHDEEIANLNIDLENIRGEFAVADSTISTNLIAEINRATEAENGLNNQIKEIKNDYLTSVNENAIKASITEVSGVANNAKSAIDAFLKDAELSESAVDTLKEIQAELDLNETGAAAMLARIQTLEAVDNATQVELDNAINTVNTEINKKADLVGMNAIDARVLSLENAGHGTVTQIENAKAEAIADAASKADAAKTEAKSYADTLKENTNQELEKIYEQMETLDGKINALPANELEVVKADLASHKEESSTNFAGINTALEEVNNQINDVSNEINETINSTSNAINERIDNVSSEINETISSTSNTINKKIDDTSSEINGKLDNATSDRAAIRVEFAEADSEIVEANTADHASIRNELGQAMSIAQSDRALIREQYAAADNALSISCEAENTSIRAEFAAKDLEITTNLNAEIARATAAEADALAQSKAYTDSVKTSILGSEQLESTFNTLTNIAAWIEGDGVNATELTEAIAVETQNRATEDAAIRQSITDLNTAINTTINELDIAHKAEIKSTNDTVAALGTELRGVDSNINARLDAAIAAHEAEDARIDAAYKAADTYWVNDIDTRYTKAVADMAADYIKRDEDIIAYFDEQLGVIMNGSY